MTHRERTRVRLTLISCLILSIAAGVTSSASDGSVAQGLRIPEAGMTQIVTLDDGSSLVGRITFVGANEIKFQTEMGEMTIAISKIREVKEVPGSAFRAGKYWYPNPNRTRLFIGPTGRMLDAGEGYFADYYLFFPGVGYGLTDNLTIGGGVSLFPWVDLADQVFYLTPKIGISAGERMNLAAGAIILGIPDWDDDDDEDDAKFVGVLFGVGTIGTDDRSLSAGLGYGFADGDLADKPAVMVGGDWRVLRRMGLVTENWVFPGADHPLVSYGVRFFGESLSVDLALFTVPGEEDAPFPGIPYVDFVWNF